MTNNIQHTTDTEILNDLRTRDEYAFETIFKDYYPLLVNYASRILFDHEIAKDLVQDIFCRLWDTHTNLNIKISLKAYLFKMTYTSCIDVIRHKKTENLFIDKTLQDYYFNQILQTPEAEIKLLNDDIRNLILSSLDSLPEKCKKIFILHKLEGKTYNETAQELGISPKTVENQITIAMSRLRKELEWVLQIIIIFT